jgi:hypothetical protein
MWIPIDSFFGFPFTTKYLSTTRYRWDEERFFALSSQAGMKLHQLHCKGEFPGMEWRVPRSDEHDIAPLVQVTDGKIASRWNHGLSRGPHTPEYDKYLEERRASPKKPPHIIIIDQK